MRAVIISGGRMADYEYIKEQIRPSDTIICADSGYNHAVKKLGIAPHDCVVFEDILAAVESAKSIGMTVYGVFDKYSEADWEQIKQTADGTISDFRNAPLPK